MRIEILLSQSEEPIIFPLNKPKVSIGSAETCDVVINAPGISRKHAVFTNEDDNFFVIDQGSTNGTYINEERLVPGRRVEFTSFFPVRLGDQVLVTLLSDEEGGTQKIEPIVFPGVAKESSSNDSTRVISLKDLKQAKTQDLVKRRQEIVTKKKTATAKAPTKKQKEKKDFLLIKILTVGIIGIAAYFNLFVMQTEDDVKKLGEETITKVEAPAPVKPVPVAPAEVTLIPDAELVPIERIKATSMDVKCASDLEKYLCDTLEGQSDPAWGVVQTGTNLIVLVNADTALKEANSLLPMPPTGASGEPPSAEEQANYDKAIREIALYLYFHRKIPATLDYELLKDMKLTFALFRQNEDNSRELLITGAILPKQLKKFKEINHEEKIPYFVRLGISTIAFAKDFYRHY